MSGKVQIVPVEDKRGMSQFLKFPFRLYRGDPNWVPPLIEERRDFFNTKKNPFYAHARYQLFLAKRDDQVVGTVGAVVDDNHNRVHDELMGAFGFFESVDDQEVAAALLGAAGEWICNQGMKIVRGPLNFSTNHEIGLLVDGWNGPPVVMMTYNPPYYSRLIESQGFAKAKDVYAYISVLDDILATAPPKFFRVADKAVERSGIRVRKADMRHFDREVEVIKAVYNKAWQKNWGFVPLTDAEIDHLAASLKQIADPNLVFVAETADGTPIGVSITLPDVHQALRLSGGGHMFPFGLIKFLWHRRHIDQVRLLVMGVIEEYRNQGIDAFFYVHSARAAQARGYKRLEGSWVLEDNTMMNLIVDRAGAQRYRTYRIYEKAF